MLKNSIRPLIIPLLMFVGIPSAFGGFLSNGRDIMRGRTALLNNNPNAALPSFEAIAQSTPDYINCESGFCVGIWTYLGRTQHELGENQQAIVSLKKGKGRHSRDRLNQVYLGLVMALTGQTEEGKAELDAGLKTLGDWLSNFAGRGIPGGYWDPGEHLQKAIAQTRSMLQGDGIDWDDVNKNIHWLGINFEQEVRDVRDQRENRRSRF